MRLIREFTHPDLPTRSGNVLRRLAARGIVLRDDKILLLFTERYSDFSFPGGGLDPNEDLLVGLARELEEETGAHGVVVRQNFGYIEEYRPHWRPEYDLMHMTSHFFVCDIAPELRPAKMEGYEIANGMRPLWVCLDEAIAHNQSVIDRQDQRMGLSITRETFMLRKVAAELR